MLDLKGIRWKTPEGDEILKGVDLTVPKGKLTVVTGPNGGGKTSLAKIIAGLYTPDEGTISLNGRDITSLDITERAKDGIAYAFQQPVRFKGLTVRDLLNLSAEETLPDNEICRILGEVGLCAEPEAGIDLWSFSNLINAFERLKNEGGRTLLVISHQERIMEIADCIAVVANGTVTEFGNREDILPALLEREKGCKCPLKTAKREGC